MKLLKTYVKLRLSFLVYYLSFVLLFLLVSYLYNDSLKSAGYVVVLCSVSVLVEFFLSFLAFKKKVAIFSYYMQQDVYTLDRLPKTKGLYDTYYHSVIENLYHRNCDLKSEYDLKYQDVLDYYTLWVHQVKIPLQALRLLSKDNQMNQQIFKVEQYVDMALQYLRVDFMNSDLLIKEYELDSILKGVLKKYADAFIQSGLAFEFKETHKIIISDAKWLSFVLEQLISNALKYTKKGHIKIYYEDGLVIEDSGIGIIEEDLQRIFEKGYTGYNGRNHKKSTGIGLYLVKKILSKLNHEIIVTSKLKEGSAFKIRF